MHEDSDNDTQAALDLSLLDSNQASVFSFCSPVKMEPWFQGAWHLYIWQQDHDQVHPCDAVPEASMQ